jgi:addiction module HigA family antidote
MATKRIPTHPGKFIQRVYLDELDISAANLASALEINKATMSRLLNEKADLSPTLALKLSEVLGRSAQSWMNMQANHSLAKIEAELRFRPQMVLKNGALITRPKRKPRVPTRKSAVA